MSFEDDETPEFSKFIKMVNRIASSERRLENFARMEPTRINNEKLSEIIDQYSR